MPQIIVTAARGSEEAVTLCERINVTDFESDHFARQLMERIGWAVSDAHEAETTDTGDETDEPALGGEDVRSDAAGYPPASVVTTAS